MKFRDLRPGDTFVDDAGTVTVLSLPTPTGAHGRVGFQGRDVDGVERTFHVQPDFDVEVVHNDS